MGETYSRLGIVQLSPYKIRHFTVHLVYLHYANKNSTLCIYS